MPAYVISEVEMRGAAGFALKRSRKYAEALNRRQTALDRRLIFVEGAAPV